MTGKRTHTHTHTNHIMTNISWNRCKINRRSQVWTEIFQGVGENAVKPFLDFGFRQFEIETCYSINGTEASKTYQILHNNLFGVAACYIRLQCFFFFCKFILVAYKLQNASSYIRKDLHICTFMYFINLLFHMDDWTETFKLIYLGLPPKSIVHKGNTDMCLFSITFMPHVMSNTSDGTWRSLLSNMLTLIQRTANGPAGLFTVLICCSINLTQMFYSHH